jgi:hypothetical protein
MENAGIDFYTVLVGPLKQFQTALYNQQLLQKERCRREEALEACGTCPPTGRIHNRYTDSFRGLIEASKKISTFLDKFSGVFTAN